MREILGERWWQPTTFAPEGPARPHMALHTPWASVTSKATQIDVWHLVQNTLMLLPAGTIDCGTAKHHYVIGEVQSAYTASLVQAGRNGNVRRIFVACGRQAIHPRLKDGGFLAHFL